MNKLIFEQTTPQINPKTCPINFNWADNPDIRNLLDVISAIIAKEYIQAAKENPEIFTKQGGYK